MPTFDEIVNAVIPWVIGIGGVYLMYRPLREPLSGLGRAIKGTILWVVRKIKGEPEDEGEDYTHYVPHIQYE